MDLLEQAKADIYARNGANGAEPERKANIFDRAMCLSLELRKLGTRRKVASEAVETDADRDMIHVSKEILESTTLDDIKKLHGEARTYIERRAVKAASSPMFRRGFALIPDELQEEVDEKLTAMSKTCGELVEKFMSEYDERRGAARERLGSLFDENDYPTPAKVRAAFSMEWSYMEFTTPGRMSRLNKARYERETAKMRASIQNATEEIQAALRGAAADLVTHLVDRLSPKPDGSAKIFRNSLVGNVREFLDTFNARNIADDAELAGVVAQAKALINGVSPESLRDDQILRDKVRDGFTTIKASLDGMLTDRPKRQINFDED